MKDKGPTWRPSYRFDLGDVVAYIDPRQDPTGQDLLREVLRWDASVQNQLVLTDETLVGGHRKVQCRLVKRARAADLVRPFKRRHG